MGAGTISVTIGSSNLAASFFPSKNDSDSFVSSFIFIIFFNVEPSHVLMQLKTAHSASHSASAWFDQSPYQESIWVLRAVIPLLLLLGAIFFMVLLQLFLSQQ